jgi:hypothetical protein
MTEDNSTKTPNTKTPNKRRLQRTNTVILLHKLKEARKFNRESIKRSRQRINEAPVSKGTAESTKPGDDEINPVSEVCSTSGSNEPDLAVRDTQFKNIPRPGSLTRIALDRPPFEVKIEPLSTDVDGSGSQTIAKKDIGVNSKQKLPNSFKVAVDVICAPPRIQERDPITSDDVEAEKPLIDMEKLERWKAEQDRNPFIQDLYRKEKIILMARIMEKVEKVCNFHKFDNFSKYLIRSRYNH